MSQNGPGDGDVGAPIPSAQTEGMPEGFLTPGQVLGDRYQIRSQLGKGGMGEVWRAFDLKLRQDVALKSPGGGLPPYELANVLGKKLTRALATDENLDFKDLTDA